MTSEHSINQPSSRETSDLGINDLTYNSDGLVPAIVQDAGNGDVLMLAWMDAEALRRTVATKTTWFFSRSRQSYWNKGEESGNTQEVVSIQYDCDGDALLVKVNQRGDGCACHTGARSCFYRTMEVEQ